MRLVFVIDTKHVYMSMGKLPPAIESVFINSRKHQTQVISYITSTGGDISVELTSFVASHGFI